MEIKRDDHNIVMFKAKNRYELCSTFWRLQEFYESPEFRGRFFEIEEYMDWYADKYGNFTYFSDWSGFNVPGTVAQDFFQSVPYELFEKEKAFFKQLKPYFEKNERFYIIGVFADDAVVDHEYSHAFYHIFNDYAVAADKMIMELPEKFRNQIYENLKEKGYHPSVYKDEAIAYLSTNDMPYTKKMAGEVAIPWEDVLKLQEHFQKWKEDKIDEDE